MAINWRKLGRRVEIITLIALVLAVTYLWMHRDDRPVATPAAGPAAADARLPAELPEALAAADPNASGGTVTLRIATLAPEGSNWAQGMRKTAEEISTLTGRRVAIRLFTGGAYGSDERVLQSIRIGRLQGTALTPSALARVYPDLAIYGLPLLFDSANEAAYVRRASDPVLQAGLEGAGFVTFCFAGTGFAHLLSTVPVSGRADLRDRHTWMPTGDAIGFAAFRALGLTPVTKPLADVYVGLQTGLVDVVSISAVDALVLQLHTEASHLIRLPVVYTYGLLVIEARTFAKIHPADQATVRNAFDKLYRRHDAAFVNDNAQALEALVGSGIIMVDPDPEMVREARQRLADARVDIIRAASISPDLYAEVMRLIGEYRGVE